MIDFTDEQKMAQKMLRQWTAKELAPQVAQLEKGEILPYDLGRKLIRSFGIDELVRARFAKLEDARAPASAARRARRHRRSGAHGHRLDGAVAGLSRLLPGLRRFAGPGRRRHHGQGHAGAEAALGPAHPRRDKVGAWSMTEPDAGSDAFGAMRTTARREGDGFVLNGQKTFITNAPYADTFVIYAKLAGADAARVTAVPRLPRRQGHARLSVGKPWRRWACTPRPPASSS